jgi:hypothetical protein
MSVPSGSTHFSFSCSTIQVEDSHTGVDLVGKMLKLPDAERSQTSR